MILSAFGTISAVFDVSPCHLRLLGGPNCELILSLVLSDLLGMMKKREKQKRELVSTEMAVVEAR